MAASPLPKLTSIPPTVAAVADYEALARERLSAGAWAYLDGGAADELTVTDNRTAFSRLRLRARVLRSFPPGSGTACEIFGLRLPYPILLAPVAYQKLAHPDGEIATVLGASAMQAGMIVSTQASFSLEDIARTAETPLWFQIYIQHDRGFTLDLVRRAEAAGYRALVLSVDAPISGLRNREQRAGFTFPPDVSAVNLRGLAPLPRGTSMSLFDNPLITTAATWKDVEWLRSQTRLPLLLKGVTSADDAARGLDVGADGIVVSNHGGRVLDGQPASIDLLPEIAEVVAGRAPVLLDGGIRRGSDVFKALALGARAVLIGRAFVHGLAAAGAIGVSHVLRILHAELEATMVLTGCDSLAAISPDAIRGDDARPRAGISGDDSRR